VTGTPRRYRLFEVVGLELEYPIVSARLEPRCLVEPAFRSMRGRPTSDLELEHVGFSNELAAHVFEIKTLEPVPSLDTAERHLVRGMREFAGVLESEHGARLLPTGMHPFMRPSETRLWRRAGRRIYRTYDRIFGIRDHGWLNVQASHVNLPFGTEAETIAMHTAIACLLPYLPAVAASSPICEGRIQPFADTRLWFYRTNQARFPIITGDVVPEYVDSFAEYRRLVLKRIYRRLDDVPGGDVIQHEWVNSRGAILRFMRQAIEIRILDTQECIKADVAIAAFVRAALRWMVDALREGTLQAPPHETLVHDFDATVRAGRAARVAAPHLRRRGSRAVIARVVLERLLELCEPYLRPKERQYAALIERRIARGNLSERIVQTVRRLAPNGGERRRRAITDVYNELASCLVENETWYD